MAKIYQFKRHKNRLQKKEKNPGRPLKERAREFFKKLGRLARQSFTLVLVPHSEKKSRNFHVTFLSLCCLIFAQLFLAGICIRHFVFAAETKKVLAAGEMERHAVQAELEKVRDESEIFFQELADFENSLSGSLQFLSRDAALLSPLPEGYTHIALEGRPALPRQTDGDPGRLRDYFASVFGQALELNSFLDYQHKILREIPSIWPIKGGAGYISSPFGPGIHPYTGKYYLHRGIDISTYRQGDPVVAAADGQVVTAEYDRSGGLGNYVIIRHKYGYYTRYGHLMSFVKKAGQQVQQGEVIGFIGNTGLSTGPHLHYEIHIGPDVTDPQKFIYLRSGKAPAENSRAAVPQKVAEAADS
jgi:murein DD-endopeptidase MepM/ murein hydrolase activator NlpD